MPTFPMFSRSYSVSGYSFENLYDVTVSRFYTGNTRQRKYLKSHDVLFNVQLHMSDSDFQVFEVFVRDELRFGADDFTGPYFTSDAEKTGTLQIVGGDYSAELVPPASWRVSYSMILRDRDMTDEEIVYDLVNGYGSFSELGNVASALADMVNNNTL